MTSANKNKLRFVQIIETIIQHIVVLFFLLILWELFKNYSFKEISTWHILLSTLGFALCMAEALLLFSKESVVLRDVDRVTRGTYHAVIMTIACILVTVGIALKVYQKDDRGREHFTTTHGRLGLAAWILTFIGVFGGLFVVNAKRFSGLAKPIWIKLFHIITGAGAYILGVTAVGFGLHYMELYTSENGRIALLILLIVYGSYSLIGTVLTSFNLVFNK